MPIRETQKRVLVVDDDDSVRDLVGSVLRRRMLDVDEAADGQAALDLLRDHRYAVIILDLLMPGVSGFDVLQRLEFDPIEAPPVVLVLTGADRSVVDRLESPHVHGIVKKPFDLGELASLVAACSEIRVRT